MPSDETDQTIKKRLNDIFPSQEVASKVVDMVVSNRPLGWGRKSIAPYYKEIYAKQMQEVADEMLANGQSKVFRFSVWCNDETGMSKNTLYNRVNQSLRYLCERMDASGKYKQWYETVRVTRSHNVGIVIEFIPGLRGESISGFKPDEIKPRENMPQWKRDMEEWLEGDSVKPFCADRLALSPEEIEEEKIKLSQLSNIQYSVKSESIKLIRVA